MCVGRVLQYRPEMLQNWRRLAVWSGGTAVHSTSEHSSQPINMRSERWDATLVCCSRQVKSSAENCMLVLQWYVLSWPLSQLILGIAIMPFAIIGKPTMDGIHHKMDEAFSVPCALFSSGQTKGQLVMQPFQTWQKIREMSRVWTVSLSPGYT